MKQADMENKIKELKAVIKEAKALIKYIRKIQEGYDDEDEVYVCDDFILKSKLLERNKPELEYIG